MNPHEVYPHRILSPTRLPIPPLGRWFCMDFLVPLRRAFVMGEMREFCCSDSNWKPLWWQRFGEKSKSLLSTGSVDIALDRISGLG